MLRAIFSCQTYYLIAVLLTLLYLHDTRVSYLSGTVTLPALLAWHSFALLTWHSHLKYPSAHLPEHIKGKKVKVVPISMSMKGACL